MYLPGRAVRRDQTGNADPVHQSGQHETQGGSIGTAGNAELGPAGNVGGEIEY